MDIDPATWDAVQTGMRQVVSSSRLFRDLEVEIAGKTGTAQENTRANHAWFISSVDNLGEFSEISMPDV